MNHDLDLSTGIFAVGTLLATDDLVADELTARGLDVKGRALGWVTAEGSLRDAYESLLWTRVGDRVVWVLDRDETPTADAFRSLVARIPWNSLLYPGMSVRVDVSGKMHWVKDTRFAGQLVMDAIRDQADAAGRPRPEYDAAEPAVRVAVRFGRGTADIGVTLNLTPLNQRGYRTEGGVAPLRETLAQVMIARLKVDASVPEVIIDPCCGSGTLLIEAAMRLMNRAPQVQRPASRLSKWLGLESISWTELVADAKSQERPLRTRCVGYDIDDDAIARARENIERAGLSDAIQVTYGDVYDLTPTADLTEGTGWILANPPYGTRLGRGQDLPELYFTLGERAKQWAGSQLGVITSEPELSQSMRLRPKKKWTMQAGGQRLTISQFVLGENPVTEAADSVQSAPPEAVLGLLNRLSKNLDKRAKLLKENVIDCYRIYDADLPEFNVVIDRFGDYLHIQEYRPPKTIDPKKASERRQLIRQWVPKHLGIPLKNAVYKERFRQTGATQYEKGDAPLWVDVAENGLNFEVNLTTYTDVGLFLDHRPLRRWLMAECKGLHVLNLFCYTGALSVAAAKGFARTVTSVDASNTYLNWAEDHFAKNGLNPKHYEFLRANILEWISDRPEPLYDLILLDPPTFSNTKASEITLDIQRDHLQLLLDTSQWLMPGGSIYFSSNARGFQLDPAVGSHFRVEDLTKRSIDADFDRAPPHVLFRLWPLVPSGEPH